MTYSTALLFRLRSSAALLLGPTLVFSLTGCATSASTEPAEAESAESPAPAEPEEVAIEEEVAAVSNCHTDEDQCALPEPLPPGAACFCPGEGGENEAGVAGE